MQYIPAVDRYKSMIYRRCGNSGLKLPVLSLGLWHNFGNITPFETQRSLLRTAFDCGITHFDLANNYGPPYGEAETNFGIHMDQDWRPHRDELILSTKAGYDMWDGPYGIGGSKKYLISSLDQSLRRMRVEYVDIFYHHCPDLETPLEETAEALAQIVRQGKALYVGISNYPAPLAAKMIQILADQGVRCLIEQPNYSMLDRWVEKELLGVLRQAGVGCICYAPLQHGLLSDRYLSGIPADSRASHDPRYLTKDAITQELVNTARKLQNIAQNRGQTLAQMALAWALRDPAVTSVLIGASRPAQILDNVKALEHLEFSAEELIAIDNILSGETK